MKTQIFESFKVTDVVFLAVISAVTLCTSAVMPLVVSLQPVVFGIANLVTSLQISFFFTVGLVKVRKTGALFIMSLFMGLFQLLMAPIMFFSTLSVSLVVELLILIMFRGYKKNCAVFTAMVLYNPLGLVSNVLYNLLFGRETALAVLTRAPVVTVCMTVAVAALSVTGALLGIKISGELEKSGVLKK